MNDNSIGAAALLDRIDLARDDSQIVRTISSMLKATDYPQLVSSFHGENTQHPPERALKFVNALDKAWIPSPRRPARSDVELIPHTSQALGYGSEPPETKAKLHRALRKTCGEVGILPSSYYLDENEIKKLNEVPFASGGYSDVWRASYQEENVSIKALRVYAVDNIKQLTKVSHTLTPRGGRALIAFNHLRRGARRS